MTAYQLPTARLTCCSASGKHGTMSCMDERADYQRRKMLNTPQAWLLGC